MVTRNISYEPEITLARLFARHDLDIGDLDFIHYLPLREEKTLYFKAARERLDINPARAFACGDEHRDYAAALAAGMHPFIVSYSFESHTGLTLKFGIPEEVISHDPQAFSSRVLEAPRENGIPDPDFTIQLTKKPWPEISGNREYLQGIH